MAWAPVGALTFDSASSLLRELEQQQPSRVNLAAVTEADSTALALLVALARRVSGQGGPLQIEAVPKGIAALIDLYGVGELFDIRSSAS